MVWILLVRFTVSAIGVSGITSAEMGGGGFWKLGEGDIGFFGWEKVMGVLKKVGVGGVCKR
ncbi:hypothetical protein, partial [Bacillus licheniformis]|uniref:hypothetical protein n=1 Tax=Bacillus licheniformis TaxID=1402 RepID=UPI0016432261